MEVLRPVRTRPHAGYAPWPGYNPRGPGPSDIPASDWLGTTPPDDPARPAVPMERDEDWRGPSALLWARFQKCGRKGTSSPAPPMRLPDRVRIRRIPSNGKPERLPA